VILLSNVAFVSIVQRDHVSCRNVAGYYKRTVKQTNKDRQTDRQTYRHTYRQTDRQIDRLRQIQTQHAKKTDKQIQRLLNKHTDSQTYRKDESLQAVRTRNPLRLVKSSCILSYNAVLFSFIVYASATVSVVTPTRTPGIWFTLLFLSFIGHTMS